MVFVGFVLLLIWSATAIQWALIGAVMIAAWIISEPIAVIILGIWEDRKVNHK